MRLWSTLGAGPPPSRTAHASLGPPTPCISHWALGKQIEERVRTPGGCHPQSGGDNHWQRQEFLLKCLFLVLGAKRRKAKWPMRVALPWGLQRVEVKTITSRL